MAVTATQLDGQNVGLRLQAQTSVQPLTLNLTTGVVTSPYLPAETCGLLQQFALSLFRVVPASSRAAGAIGLLSRLCAVSAADESGVTLSASVSVGVATLTATIDESPGSLILTTPYAQTGGVMPSSGGGSSPPPTPSGADTNLVTVSAFGIDVGALVRIDPDSGDAEPADCRYADFMPCVGVVESIIDATHVSVRVGGRYNGFDGLSVGRIYYAGQAGELTLTPPTTVGQVVQPFGFALTETTLAVAPAPTTIVADASSGGGGSTQIITISTESTFETTSPEALLPGMLVARNRSGTGVVAARANDSERMPAVGMVAVVSGSAVTVQTAGRVTGRFTPTGEPVVFVGLDSQPTASLAGVQNVQSIGVWATGDTLILSFTGSYITRSLS